MPRVSVDEALHRPKAKRTLGLLPVQNQVYTAMASALLSPEAPVSLASRGGGSRGASRTASAGGVGAVTSNPELPRPRGNLLYHESRYFYNAPKEPEAWHCTACVECSDVFPALAAVKCYSCAKYDAQRKGHFCQQCFDARHPWHRQPHKWLPLTKAEDLEHEVKGQRVRAEMDHRIAGIEELLQSTAATRRILEAQSVDPLTAEIVGDTRAAIVHADSEVKRVQRKLRDDVELRALVAAGDLNARRDTASRGWGGGETRAMKPRPGHSKLEADYFTHLRAAMVLQKGYRRRIAKRALCRRVGQLYQKVWDEGQGRFYFLQSATKNTSWEPPHFLKGDLKFLLTPRTFERRKQNGEFTFEALYRLGIDGGVGGGFTGSSLSVDAAAVAVQAAWRRKLGLKEARKAAAQQWQRVKDPSSGRYYFVNVKKMQKKKKKGGVKGGGGGGEQAVSWKRPVVFAGNKELCDEMIQTPRAFQLTRNLERRARETAAAAAAAAGGEGADAAGAKDSATPSGGGAEEEGEEEEEKHVGTVVVGEGGGEWDNWGEEEEEGFYEWGDAGNWNASGDDGELSTALVLSPPTDLAVLKDDELIVDEEPLPSGWEEVYDYNSQQSYFTNVATGEVSWAVPVAASSVPGETTGNNNAAATVAGLGGGRKEKEVEEAVGDDGDEEVGCIDEEVIAQGWEGGGDGGGYDDGTAAPSVVAEEEDWAGSDAEEYGEDRNEGEGVAVEEAEQWGVGEEGGSGYAEDTGRAGEVVERREGENLQQEEEEQDAWRPLNEEVGDDDGGGEDEEGWGRDTAADDIWGVGGKEEERGARDDGEEETWQEGGEARDAGERSAAWEGGNGGGDEFDTRGGWEEGGGETAFGDAAYQNEPYSGMGEEGASATGGEGGYEILEDSSAAWGEEGQESGTRDYREADAKKWGADGTADEVADGSDEAWQENKSGGDEEGAWRGHQR